MARPSKFDRREALNAAMNAIWKNGFEPSSVKTLSELLGITRSSFYNAFGSREALLREAISEYAEQSPDAPLRTGDAASALRLINKVFRDICRVRSSDPEAKGCLIVNTVCELCPDTEGLGAELSDLVLGSAKNLERLLAVARDADELPRDADIHALALALQNLMIGLNVLCKVVRSEDELWLLTRTTLEGLGLDREVVDA
jgi:TetR/AcrR family transcriptional regulator, transcriptional repressor for nem operon